MYYPMYVQVYYAWEQYDTLDITSTVLQCPVGRFQVLYTCVVTLLCLASLIELYRHVIQWKGLFLDS